MKDVFVHPTALVESTTVGEGTRIWAFAHVMQGAVVGRECNVGDHSFIESGVRVGDRCTIKNLNALYEGLTLEEGVFVGPGVRFTNDLYPRSPRLPEAAHRYTPAKTWSKATLVKRGATLGAGCVILAGVTIGDYATVGAGAVVTKDVPAHALVTGNPTVVVGHVCKCGLRIRFDAGKAECAGCKSRYVQDDQGVHAR